MSNGAGDSGGSADSQQCCICLNDMTLVHSEPIFRCPHAMMHESCVVDWICSKFTTRGLMHTTCPLCRAPIKLPLPDHVHKAVQEAFAQRCNPIDRAFIGAVLSYNFADAVTWAARGANETLAMKVMLFERNFDAASALTRFGVHIARMMNWLRRWDNVILQWLTGLLHMVYE